MSWMTGPRSHKYEDIDAWTEELLYVLSQAGRQGAEADAAWHTYIMHKFPTCWLVYLAPTVVLAGAAMLSWLGGGFLGIGVGNAEHHDWGMILFALVILIFVLVVIFVMFAAFVAGFWQMNWVGKIISIWYVYSMACYMLRSFHELPFTIWLGCLAASMGTEAIANAWKRHESPTD